MPRKVVIPIVTVMFILAGCGPARRKPLEVCPGKDSVLQALHALRVRSEKAVELRASGTSQIVYYVEGKRHKENMTVKVGVNPPAGIYLQGDAGLVPKVMVGGSNEREFWLAIKPKGVSSYWWGLWSENNYGRELMLSPRIVLEALGLAVLDGGPGEQGDWSLSNEGPFDVLTRRSDTGLAAKKIYVHSCGDYLVRKIEYFNELGQVEVVAELDKYKDVVEGFCVPRIIRIAKRGETEDEDSVRVTLKSVKPYEFSQKQLEGLFNRPEPRGFKHEYRVVDGRWIEQPQ